MNTFNNEQDAAGIAEIRSIAGYSQTAAAALANVSPHTWKVFELNRHAVKNAKKRAACEAALARMVELARRAA